jgi:hypothetical protein
MKRLDLDAARSKQKKNKMLNSQHNTPVAMTDVSSFFPILSRSVRLVEAEHLQMKVKEKQNRSYLHLNSFS